MSGCGQRLPIGGVLPLILKKIKALSIPGRNRGVGVFSVALSVGGLGCSLQLDLEGPPAYIKPVGFDAGMEDAAGLEAGPQDGGLDTRAVDGMAAAEIQAPAGTTVLRHPGGAGVVEAGEVPADGRLPVAIGAGDWLTLVFRSPTDGEAWLVTLADVQPGEVVPVAHPAPPVVRTTSLVLRLDQPFRNAAGYVASNGCVELRCEGVTCDPWLAGRDRSMAVTDRCIGAGERVRSLAIARTMAGEALAWAAAEDPVPEEAGGRTTFGPWQASWHEATLTVSTRVSRVQVMARPFNGVPFGVGPATRMRVDGQASMQVRAPDGFAPQTEVAIDLEGEAAGAARDRAARAWRRVVDALPPTLEVALDDEVPELTAAHLVPDLEGPRPAVQWSPAGVAEDVARVEIQWEHAGDAITWIFFGSPLAVDARLPELPDRLADLRPPPATEGTYAQLSFVRCDGVATAAAHRQHPCPIYGAGATPEAGRTVAWSSTLALPPPPPPPPDLGVDAGLSDAGMMP